MSTTWEFKNFSLTRFWGGKKVGQMYQITQKCPSDGTYHYVQLNVKELDTIKTIVKGEVSWKMENGVKRFFLNILKLKR